MLIFSHGSQIEEETEVNQIIDTNYIVYAKVL